MIAEVMTGIALVKQSVDFIKSQIDTCKDIGEIAGSIDGLFQGQEEVNRARNKKSGATGLGDQFGVDTVAKEMLDAKIAAEKLQEVSTLVDLRFGPGTWAGIVAERAKRIQEAKEAAKKARIAKMKADKEFWEMIQTIAIICGAAAIALGAFVYILFFNGPAELPPS